MANPVSTGLRLAVASSAIETGDIVTLTGGTQIVRVTAILGHNNKTAHALIAGTLVGGLSQDPGVVGTTVTGEVSGNPHGWIRVVRGVRTNLGDVVTGTCVSIGTTVTGTVTAILAPPFGDTGVRYVLTVPGEPRRRIVF